MPGKAVITAVASGHALTTVEVETVSSLGAEPPLRLALYASPAKMLPQSQPYGRLSLVLLGSNGRLVSAAESLELVLSSSDPDVVRVAPRVTIPKGFYFVTTDLEPLAVGSATLSAVRSGFISDFIEVHVVEPGERAEALVLYLSPPILRSSIESHMGVIVQAVDDSGNPVPFPCAQVHLASSSPLSVKVSPVVDLTCGQDVQYVMGALNTGNLPGTAIINAVATGLRPDTGLLKVQGPASSQLKAYLAPEGLLEAEAIPGFIVVQALDAGGKPVISHGGIPVEVVGGSDTLQGELVIEEGQSYVTLRFERLKIRETGGVILD